MGVADGVRQPVTPPWGSKPPIPNKELASGGRPLVDRPWNPQKAEMTGGKERPTLSAYNLSDRWRLLDKMLAYQTGPMSNSIHYTWGMPKSVPGEGLAQTAAPTASFGGGSWGSSGGSGGGKTPMWLQELLAWRI